MRIITQRHLGEKRAVCCTEGKVLCCQIQLDMAGYEEERNNIARATNATV